MTKTISTASESPVSIHLKNNNTKNMIISSNTKETNINGIKSLVIAKLSLKTGNKRLVAGTWNSINLTGSLEKNSSTNLSATESVVKLNFKNNINLNATRFQLLREQFWNITHQNVDTNMSSLDNTTLTATKGSRRSLKSTRSVLKMLPGRINLRTHSLLSKIIKFTPPPSINQFSVPFVTTSSPKFTVTLSTNSTWRTSSFSFFTSKDTNVLTKFTRVNETNVIIRILLINDTDYFITPKPTGQKSVHFLTEPSPTLTMSPSTDPTLRILFPFVAISEDTSGITQFPMNRKVSKGTQMSLTADKKNKKTETSTSRFSVQYIKKVPLFISTLFPSTKVTLKSTRFPTFITSEGTSRITQSCTIGTRVSPIIQTTLTTGSAKVTTPVSTSQFPLRSTIMPSPTSIMLPSKNPILETRAFSTFFTIGSAGSTTHSTVTNTASPVTQTTFITTSVKVITPVPTNNFSVRSATMSSSISIMPPSANFTLRTISFPSIIASKDISGITNHTISNNISTATQSWLTTNKIKVIDPISTSHFLVRSTIEPSSTSIMSPSTNLILGTTTLSTFFTINNTNKIIHFTNMNKTSSVTDMSFITDSMNLTTSVSTSKFFFILQLLLH